jgi:hypothetical protein
MTRPQLEHIIRAAAATANVREIVVVGSQAILGAFPNAPPELTRSLEADVYPKDNPQRSDLIDGAMGELSLFHDTFGYYAHGVDDRTSTLPDGWSDRLIRVDSAGSVGWCIEPHDLAVSKLAAGRPNDLSFVEIMVRWKLVSVEIILSRLDQTPRMTDEARAIALARINAWRQGA